MLEPLKNCPNCAGLLNESGVCRYCGSKVYDFLTLDFDCGSDARKKGMTYIRIKSGGKVMLFPILGMRGASINIRPNEIYCNDILDGRRVIRSGSPEIEVDLSVYCGEGISD